MSDLLSPDEMARKRPRDELLTLEQAAKRLTISRRTLNRLIAAGRIRALQVSEGRKAIEAREIDAYLASLRRVA